MIDIYAQSSRLNTVNPSLKLWSVLILMTICVLAKSPVVGLFVAAVMIFLTVCIGRLELCSYIKMLLLPLSFLMFSGLAMLLELTTHKAGVLSFPIAGYWLSVSEFSQARTLLIISRALGALSCLYLLSLTTPMSGLIAALRRARLPNLLISLMYLIYRYIFILLSVYRSMKEAAVSRLGFVTYRISIRTTTGIYGNLLAHSYRHAGINFNAMESRCYDSEIRFLERENKITATHTAVAIAVIATTLGLSLWLTK